jgi:pantothenate kinase
MEKVNKINEFRRRTSLSKPTEKISKISAKMVVIVGLLAYLLAKMFILKNIYYFRTCNQ